MSQLSPRPKEKKSKITNKKIPINTTLNKIKTKSRIATKTSSNVATKIGFSNLTIFKANQQTDLNTVQNPTIPFKATALSSSHQLDQETSLVSVPFIPKLDTEPLLAADKPKVTTTLRQEQSARSVAVIKRKRRGLRKTPQSVQIDNAKKTADTTAEIIEADDKEPMLRTDVEVFQGKIVFNSNGNAFIIATESSTDSVANATVAQKTAATAIATGNEIDGEVTLSQSLTPSGTTKAIPLGDASSIATLKGASCNRGINQASWLTSSTSPRIHSFRIVSAQDATATVITNRSATVKSSVEQTKFGTYSEHQQQQQLQQEQQSRSKNTDTNDNGNESETDNDNENDSASSNSNIVQRSSKIQKPILMCFICKLSFGNTKSFSLHANCEHQLTLHPKERNLLNREYSSAIIQPPNMDECPQISFLEPIDMLKVIRNDDINSETDVQKFNEDSTMQQSSTCRLRSAGNTAMPDRSTSENIINEKSDQIAAITGVTISNSTLTLPSTADSISLSPDLSKSTPASPKSVLSSVSTAQHSTLPSSVKDCINNSHLLLATSLSDCIHEQKMNEAGDVLAKNAVMATNTKFDNKVRKQLQKPQEYKTNDTAETADIGPFKLKDITMSPSIISSSVPKSEAENITKGDYTAYDMLDSRRTTDADFVEDATILEKSRQKVCRTLSTTNVVNSNIDVPYSGDCPSPSSLTTVSKTETDILDMSSATATTPTTVADILQLQRSSVMTSFAEPSSSVSASTAAIAVDDNKFEQFDELSCTKNFLQQQQQQYVSMCGSNFATPQAALMSIAPTRNHLSCLHDSLAVLSDSCGNTNSITTEMQKTTAKLFSDFLQQHLNLKNQQQCSENFEYKGIDCKNCDMQSSPFCSTSHLLTIKTTQQRSPTRSSSSCSAVLQTTANLPSSSPTNSATVNVSAAAMAAAAVVSQQQQQNAAAASAANNTSSFTIGACSEHINGRLLGVECTRCEMILNSTRLNTGVQMSTRNSCKTLKCPQCNWHYKYQETLEIHMREKHPDGESACGYCLSGQQHPRLARGESYSCGYKPYRCEICNYSTTTKGNLSIHMQSDKHLNNMQELNSSQSMLAAAVAAASGGKTDVASKMLLPNNIAVSQQPTLSQSQTQQAQSALSTTNSTIAVNNGDSSSSVSGRASVDGIGNSVSMLHKNKPSFRCDICSYETSVARNLRIHMTSEKHTHNMAALQSNIKHIQAYSFLHQHQQAVAAQHQQAVAAQHQQAVAAQHQQQQLAVATQAVGLESGLAAGSFLPEIALADLAYNQAVMIQLLQHNSAALGQQHQHNESVSEIQTSPRSSPRAMHIEQQSTLQQQQQLQQLRQHLQQSCSPNSSSPTLLLPSAPFSSSELNLSSNVAGGGGGVCRADETLEPLMRADPFPIKLYSCLICDVFSSNSLDELNQHLLTDRSRCSNSIVPASSIDGSSTNSSVTNASSIDVMVTLNNNYICRLCNYKTNLKANFQLHSKTDKHLQKLNYVNHIREGGPDNEYKLKYLQLAANTIKLKCNCCDFYTNSIQKLSLHTQHMRHETMHMIFQHLLCIMQQNNIDKGEIAQQQKQRQHQQQSLHPKATHLATDSVTLVENSVTDASLNITPKDMSKSLEKSLTCQLCSYSTSTLLNMIQHVKSMRHIQIEQFVILQRHSEQLDPPSLDDIFKVMEQPILQSFYLTTASTPQEDKNKFENLCSVPTPGYFPLLTAHITNDDTSENTPGIDQNSFSPSSNSSMASGNTSVLSKSYQNMYTPNSQTSIDDRNVLRALGTDTASVSGNIPSVVFKCNCDFFAQSKTEMELHFSTVHPQTEPDYISIPTNSAAIQAFQAAVAAATAAAATATRSSGNNKSNDNDNIDDSHTLIKRERLCSPEDEDADKQETISLQSATTIAPCPKPSNTETKSNKSEIEINDTFRDELGNIPEDKIARNKIELRDNESVYARMQPALQPHTAVQCPLCTEVFDCKENLELHLMNVHSVNRDGLARLLQLVDTSVWRQFTTSKAILAPTTAIVASQDTNIADEIETKQQSIKLASPASDTNVKDPTKLGSSLMETSDEAPLNLNSSSHTLLFGGHSMDTGISNELSCEQCCTQFKHEQQLLQHAKEMQHFITLPNGDHRCLAAGHPSRPCCLIFPTQATMITHYKNTHVSLVISERHVYKYRCKQCSLAFKTQEKLSTHLLYHTMRDATKCTQCQRNFRSIQALQKHTEQAHHNNIEQPEPSISPTTVLSCSSLESPAAADLISDNVTKSKEANVCTSPPATLLSKEQIDAKTLHEPQVVSSPLPTHIMQDQQQQQHHQQQQQHQKQQQHQQQQHVAAITAALLNQPAAQQQNCSSHELTKSSSILTPANLMQHLKMKPIGSLLTQKYLQQQQQQSLQNIQQVPQITAAASATGLQLNPVEMLNLMQFHHIMSMNFMNLAPPLIFGIGTNAGISGSADLLTPEHTSKIAHNSGPNALMCESDMTISRTPGSVGPDVIGTLQQQLQPQQSAAPSTSQQMTSNQKRARTRITDEQLKILRAHFDINNSPSEESIMEMSQKANLPMKVVKHWFRNTLFKERQRNKDSPYNFNNPPSTTLNLEEYERTGQAKVTALNEDLHMASLNLTQDQQKDQKHQLHENKIPEASNEIKALPEQKTRADSPVLMDIKSEPYDDSAQAHPTIVSPRRQQYQQQQEQENQQQKQRRNKKDKHLLSTASALLLHQRQQCLTTLNEHQVADMQEQASVGVAVVPMLQQQQQHLHEQPSQSIHHQQHINLYNYETKSESGSSDILSRPQSPSNPSTVLPMHYANINELVNQQLDNLPLSQNLSSISVANMHGNNMGPPKNFQSSKSFDKNSPSSQFDTNSNSSNASSTSSGKRANRTRFTDYQIKVLQEFFENNSYPKDSDLEYLSKLLLLSPRVIVVWFQNARQKQRKIYENQPNNSLYETEEKKHNINYACKKCNLAFQRYYELIRHQKNHCFKEENNKKSAKAQIAAAQIAQNLSSEDSNSSIDINSGSGLLHPHSINVAAGTAGITVNTASISSISPGTSGGGLNALPNSSPQNFFGKSSLSVTDFSPSTTPTPPQTQRECGDSVELTTQAQGNKSKFECDKCKLQFSYYDHFREHQLLHLMNPGLFATQFGNIPEAYGSFGSILQSIQQVAANSTQQQQQQILQQQGASQPPAKKRKTSETSAIVDALSPVGSTGDIDTSNAFTSSMSNNKKYRFLHQYFMQNEGNNEVKQQSQAQVQQQSLEPEFEMEYLANFYYQSEIRKRSNYNFLYQYYQKNEGNSLTDALQPRTVGCGADNKPHINFLLQYYQLNESKKFFQLDASNQQVNDDTTASPTLTSQYQHSNNPISNSEFIATSMSNMKLTKNSLNELNSSVIKLSDCNEGNIENETNNNDCGINVDDAKANPVTGTDYIDDNNRKFEKQIYRKRPTQVTKTNNVKANNDEDDEYAASTSSMAILKDMPKNFCQQELTDLSKTINAYGKNPKHIQTKRKSVNQTQLLSKSKTPKSTCNAEGTYIQNMKEILVANHTTTETTSHSIEQAFIYRSCNDDVAATKLTATPSSPPNSNAVFDSVESVELSNSATTKPATGIAERQQSKRLRTTILPEQLNFLYECYQNESNPSRKMLEEIAKKVNLKKRVVQVWFQNSRAKDKKSRNQRFSAVSDDSNYEDASQINRDSGVLHKNISKSTKPYGNKECINFLADGHMTVTTSTAMELGDCNLCQLPQVNIQQHAFSMQHICKVKKFLEQTSTDSKVTIDMGSNVSEAGKNEYINETGNLQKPIADGNYKKIYVTNNSADNSKQAEDIVAKPMTDIATGDRLCTFTRIYEELKLNNAMKQALGPQRDNVKNSELEFMNNQNSNDVSMSSKSDHDIQHKDEQQYHRQPMTNLISRTKMNDGQEKNGNGSKSEAREDTQVYYNKYNNIINHKLFNTSNYICDNEISSKSSYFQTNAQVATCLSESDVNDNDDDKDSNDGSSQDLYDNTDIQKRLKRYDTITTNNNSNNSTSSSLSTTAKACTNLKNSHAKLINCSQITVSGGK